ncbi:MAG: hypothetical protein ACLFSB_06670 [Chitinispirillaceae bacterium]
MNSIWLIIISLMLVTGCYTQFSTIDRSENYVTDGDTLSEGSEPDTVVVTERERCYWHRSFWGEPVLRCYKTTYDHNWYSYYSRPWWYRSMFYDGYHDTHSPYHGCSCPYHSYYHPNCRYCWERCDSRCYDCDDSHSGGSGTGGGTVSRPPSTSPGSGHSGSGQVIKRGNQEPLITGPRPDYANQPSPKRKSGEKVNRSSQPSQDSRTVSPADSSRAPAVQPRRHFGRGR